jgi:hypothetical protein
VRCARSYIGVAVVAIVAACVGPVALATRASADADTEGQFVARINELRADLGLGSLSQDARLTAVARSWSNNMAGANRLYHDMALPRQVNGWVKLGENVGVGDTVDALSNAFEASPPHLEHLVDPAYTLVGVGVVQVGDKLWVTEEFERPAAPERAAVRPIVMPEGAVVVVTHGQVLADPQPQLVASPVVRVLDRVRSWATGVADVVRRETQ